MIIQACMGENLGMSGSILEKIPEFFPNHAGMNGKTQWKKVFYIDRVCLFFFYKTSTCGITGMMDYIYRVDMGGPQ